MNLEFQDQINILVGANGSGKSSILDCLAIMLSRLIGRIQSSKGTGRFFIEQDISRGAIETQNSVKTIVLDDEISWKVTKTKKGSRSQKITKLTHLKKLADSIHDQLEQDEKTNLPLAIYYPVNRAVLDIPLRIRRTHSFDPLSAYDQALSGKERNFRVFFEWFRNQEDLENERRTNDSTYRDKQLTAVRTALEAFLPGFSELRVERSPLRMTIKKENKKLIVNQLSHGEKGTLAIIGDLARRLAVANPGLEDPLCGAAVILIDEIDLHLHPEWQRMIIPKLCETFPQCQFIVSTHSPQILSHVRSESIYLLHSNESGISYMKPDESFGKNSDRILEDLMDVPARPEPILQRLNQLAVKIDEKHLTSAKAMIQDLRQDIGNDPELLKAEVLIRRKEILNK